MIIRASLLFVSLVLLAGCVSAPMPVPADYRGPLATIADTSTQISAMKVQFFQLAKVDGRNVETSSAATYSRNYGRGFFMEPQLESRGVPATKAVLTIEGVTHVAAPILAFGGGMYRVDGDVTVTLEPNKIYSVKGTLSKEYCAVWVEDGDGNVISEKIEKRKP